MARYTASAPQGLQGRPILLRHQLAYGGGNLLGSGALAISGAWLLYFYTTFCGLTLIEASFIFSVASIIDAISNPLMGYLTDNFGKTRLGKRFGRRRFFWWKWRTVWPPASPSGKFVTYATPPSW